MLAGPDCSQMAVRVLLTLSNTLERSGEMQKPSNSKVVAAASIQHHKRPAGSSIEGGDDDDSSEGDVV